MTKLPHHDYPNLSSRQAVDNSTCRVDKKNGESTPSRQVEMASRHPNLSSRHRVDKIIGWGKVSRQVVDIFRCPLDNFDRLPDRAKTRNRQTQITHDDPPFQILAEKKGWLLIRMVDGTFGWIPDEQVKRIKDLNYWTKIKLVPRNKTTPLPYPDPAKTHRILKEFEGIPYLWGGTTPQGFDCSAFIQKLFFKLFGILLPRNSREQKKCGTFVYSTALCPLDILFFVHSTTSRHHVGVYLDEKVWHFCLNKKGLSTEPLDKMKKRYKYLTARRLFEFQNS